MRKDVMLLDCTIRDGGYINDWKFDNKLVREVYRATSKCGVDYVELGFRTAHESYSVEESGIWKYTPENLLNETVAHINGAKIVLMGDYGKVTAEDFLNKKNSLIDLVRIAVHKNNVFKAIDELERVKVKGYEVSLQCMGYSNYSDLEKKELLLAIKDSGLDYIYVADSYGSLYPFEIEGLLAPFVDLGNIKVGFHPHNNLQMAFANTLEAIRCGVDIVDSSIYGMGRGAGNLPTEILLAYMTKRNPDRYNVIPVLNCIDQYFLDLMKETPWGYQLPYMVSGSCRSHPYYSKDLVDRREYTIDNVWRVLNIIEEMNPIGYDKKIVNNLIEKGILGLGKEEVKNNKLVYLGDINLKEEVTYKNRHEGRDFLILANGPTLKEYKRTISEFIKKYDPIILGSNYLSDLFMPHYHAFNNVKRFLSYAETVNSNSKLLVGENIPADLVSEHIKRDYEILRFRNILNTKFDINDGIITSNCRTISVLLIAVAVVMGAKRVYLAGMDGYLNLKSVKQGLFYQEKAEPESYSLNIERHNWNEHFLEEIDKYVQNSGGEGIHIITPTTHSKFYKGIDNYK